MKAHRWVRQVEITSRSEFETIRILEAMAKLNFGPSHIDIGRLSIEYFDKEQGAGASLDDFVADRRHTSLTNELPEALDVVLFGFGRIGRLMARILVAKTDGGDNLRLRAIVVRKEAPRRSQTCQPAASRFGTRRFSGHDSSRRRATIICCQWQRNQGDGANAPEDVDYEAWHKEPSGRRQHGRLARP